MKVKNREITWMKESSIGGCVEGWRWRWNCGVENFLSTLGFQFIKFSLSHQIDVFASILAFNPRFVMVIIVLTIHMIFVVSQPIIDDLGKIMRDFGTRAKVSGTIKTFMFFGSDGGLGDNHKFADFSVTKLITIAVTVIPEN